MSDDLRPRRSVLYMPAANARALEKAKGIAADALIFDLEDAVAPDAKETARKQAADAARSGEYGRREIAIRCNGLDTPWGADDIAAAAAAGPDAILIPKVSGPEYLADVAQRMDAAGATAKTTLWAMVETPIGIQRVAEIAAFDRLNVMVMGTNDMAKELRAELVEGRHPLVPHLATCVLAARGAGKAVIDGVYNDLKNAEGFAAEARQGQEMGFDGKTLIHPNQVSPTNDAFAPSDDEVAHARKVIEAWDQAQAEGKGVVTVDGRMIENLHVDNARRAIAMADAIAALAS